MRLATRIAAIALGVFAFMQIVRPAKTNPSVNPGDTLQAHVAAAHPAIPVIARACRDCHSHETTWPWYSQVAPVSWLVAHDVNEARRAVNFSTWSAYRADRQRKLLKESCEEARGREMPLAAYTLIHPDAKLTPQDVRAICDLTAVN